MSVFKQFKTSNKAESDGVLVKFAANENGTIPTFIIARMSKGNHRYTRAIEARTKPYRKDILDKAITNEIAEDINLNVFCDAILLGWENIFDEDGKLITYSWDNAKKLMQDLPDLYDTLKEKAESIDNFLAANLAEEAKN